MKRLLRAIAERVILLAVTLLIIEGVLRLCEFQPLGSDRFGNSIGLVQMDPMLGWRLKPGVFESGPVDGESLPITVTQQESRKTKRTDEGLLPPQENPIIFIGGSSMMGTGLYDHETLPWLLQSEWTDREVYNFGTIGYGSCQSLILLKRLLEKTDSPTVIYGFPLFHESRNVAHPAWVWRLAYKSPAKGAYIPYCDLNEAGELRIHPPTRYHVAAPGFTLNTALGTLLYDVYYSVQGRERYRAKRQVTEKIILEMKRLVEEKNGEFATLLQYQPDAGREHYLAFHKKHNINVIDGTHPQQDQLEYRARDGSHPGFKLTQFWAQQIDAFLLNDS